MTFPHHCLIKVFSFLWANFCRKTQPAGSFLFVTSASILTSNHFYFHILTMAANSFPVACKTFLSSISKDLADWLTGWLKVKKNSFLGPPQGSPWRFFFLSPSDSPWLFLFFLRSPRKVMLLLGGLLGNIFHVCLVVIWRISSVSEHLFSLGSEIPWFHSYQLAGRTQIFFLLLLLFFKNYCPYN